MTLRVIQWATGAMGKACLRAVIDHPGLELAGVFVYGEAKAGRDAGEIARRPMTGVKATRDIDRILALDADVVIHAARLAPPYGSHDDDICRLLASGKNVISINGYSFPQHWGGKRLAALEAACARGGVSLMAAGLNPGFAAEKIAVAASSICARIDSVEVVETVDCREVRSPDYVFGVLGFGSDAGRVNPNDPAWGPAAALNGMYEEVVAGLACRLGVKLDRIVTDHVVCGATRDLDVAAGSIPAGSVSHFNWRWRGLVGDRCVLTHSIFWVMETSHLQAPDPPLWRVHIKGSPGIRLSIDLEPPEGAYSGSAETLGVAGSVVNAIPLILASPAGVIACPAGTPYNASYAELRSS